jgi:hypothetical protein
MQCQGTHVAAIDTGFQRVPETASEVEPICCNMGCGLGDCRGNCAAAIEMATAKAFMKTPKLVARITTATAKRHNVADVIAKVNNIRDKVSKATGIHTSVPVDQSKTPVKEMIKEADDARKGRPGESVLCRTKDCAGSGRLLHWREPAPKLTSVGLPL